MRALSVICIRKMKIKEEQIATPQIFRRSTI